MKANKSADKKAMESLNGIARILTAQSANSACAWMFHQPKFPESANKFKK